MKPAGSGALIGHVMRTASSAGVAAVAALLLAACGAEEDGDGATARSAATDQAATERHDFAAVERCVDRRTDGATEPARGPLGLAEDAFFVELPGSPGQSAVVAVDDDAHALVAAYRRLGTYGFVDQEGVNLVIAWQEFPAPEHKAVIEACL